MSHFLFRNGSGGGGGEINLIDNLESTSITSALTANQGRELKKLIDDHESKSVFGEDGIHGLRYFEGKLQVFEEPDWKDITSKEEEEIMGYTLLHRNTYISSGGNKTYTITLENYDQLMPTVVSRNGIVLPPTDYTITGNQVTLNVLNDGSLVQLLVWYNTDPKIISSIEEYRDVYVAQSGQDTFEITSPNYDSTIPIVVSRGGIILIPDDYSVVDRQVKINNVSPGVVIQLMTWNKTLPNDMSPVDIHTDTYTDTIGKREFDINIINYNPLYPTIVTRGGIILPPSDYSIINENGQAKVRFDDEFTNNAYIQIYVWEGLTGNNALVYSVNGMIGHVTLTNDDVNAPSKQEFEEVKKKASRIYSSNVAPMDKSLIWEDTSI